MVLISHKAYLTRSAVCYSSVLRIHLTYHPRIIPPVPVFLLSNWFTFLRLVPFQKTTMHVPSPPFLKSYAFLYTVFPYISLQSSSQYGNMNSHSDTSLHHQAFWAGCNKADGAEWDRAEDRAWEAPKALIPTIHENSFLVLGIVC